MKEAISFKKITNRKDFPIQQDNAENTLSVLELFILMSSKRDHAVM